MIKSRRLRWAGHVVRMEEGRSALKNLTGTPTVLLLQDKPRGRTNGYPRENCSVDDNKIYFTW